MANLGSSPARKKQRLSSPSYEGLIDDLSQDELNTFDEIEARYSQATQSSSAAHHEPTFGLPNSQNTTTTTAYIDPATKSTFPGFGSAVNALSSSEDRGKPASAPAASPSIAKLSTGFASARHLPLNQRSPAPDNPPEEPDYDSWFAPASTPAIIGFQTAKSVAAPNNVDLGFKTAGGKGVLALSADALEKAAKLMREWEEQVEEELKMTQPSTSALPENATNPFVSTRTPQRPILRPVQNGLSTPGTPTPVGTGFSRAPAASAFLNSTEVGFDAQGKGKAFKPPSTARSNIYPGPSHMVSPLNPNRPAMMSQTPAAKAPHPLASTPVASTAFRTPARATVTPQQLLRLGLTPSKPVNTTSKVKRFSTPFKAGMKPGEPGRIQLQKEQEKQRLEQVKPPTAFSQELAAKPPVDKRKRMEHSFFDLSPLADRQSLSSCGLRPQAYTSDDLELLGIPFSELSQITPDLALYYCFHSIPSDGTPIVTLDPDAALEELLRRGCSLATKPWVDNHWGLILWKLAGMVCLEPRRESEAGTRRWAWPEVLNQLLYRYERELNGGKRPPLKLIASKDSPASSPMVLCVSKITWSEAGVSEGGAPILPFPSLEVTDGWYRMRADVDAPLARAIRRKVIRVGRKIAVVDARLSSARKEPYDILEAYDAISLKLSGNSSHLAPWHTKLGFQRKASVSTLHSLTPDGGNAAVMNLVISKVYPVAYLEFVEDEDGKKHRQGPRTEKDENALQDRWKRKREAEESKLRFTMEKRLSQMENYADRMEQKAGSRFHPGEDDCAPDKIDDIYDRLENATSAQASVILGRLTFMEAGWLARLIRERVLKEREQSRDEFESELNSICPPREVRDFRVIVARDARTEKKPGNRTAQITVWNVLNLVFDEGGKAGAFAEGQKFLVTNLIPTQQGAWMSSDGVGESEIYLSTRRDSRWTRIS